VIVLIDKHFCVLSAEIPHDFCASCPAVNSNVNPARVPTKIQPRKTAAASAAAETKYKTRPPKLEITGLVCSNHGGG
jgi:hypothetical protein